MQPRQPPATSAPLPLPLPVFDGHNDVLARLWLAGDGRGAAFFAGRASGHIDLARARTGGLVGGLFAIWVPGGANAAGVGTSTPPDHATARKAQMEMAQTLVHMAQDRPDALHLCRTRAQIEAAVRANAIAAVMHLEGCEGIGPDLAELEVLHGLGLRSLGPVWSRPNIFGHGVPFRHNASPDIGPGLTEAGVRLVRACNAQRVLIDLSHLNEAGFWDVARLSTAPLVATHSNAHALCPASRNLTDRQLAAIADSGGLVGLNLAVDFLRPDGRRDPATPLAVAVRHLAHLVDRLGEGGVALGSDFDGATMPAQIGSAAGLPALALAMEAADFGPTLIRRILWGNWLDLLGRVIG